MSLAAISSIVAIIVREFRQWPSSRWWDPWMDWAFFGVGACLGIYLGFYL